MEPVVFGSVGLGGYAWSVCNTLMSEREQPGGSDVRLLAVCEPNQALHAGRVEEVKQRGVKVLHRYEDLLAEPVDAVWLPLPIPLHRSFTEQGLRAGKAIICEKPAAGCIDDVDAMIAVQQQTGLPVAIGYQDIYDPVTMRIKRMLLGGRIGKPVSATLYACWPRGDEYYQRNAWAGTLRRDGVWVLDSPVNNALAHYLNLAMFLLGPTEPSAAEPAAVDVELYRARPIENYDTISMRIALPGELPLTVLMTHACRTTVHPHITITGTQGSVDLRVFDQVQIRSGQDRQVETISLKTENRFRIPQSFAHWMRGQPIDGAIATLESARPHAVVVSGASEAAPVHDVPAEFTDRVSVDARTTVNAIRGIEEIFARCIAKGQLLSESGFADWSKPLSHKDLRGYRHFAGPRG